MVDISGLERVLVLWQGIPVDREEAYDLFQRAWPTTYGEELEVTPWQVEDVTKEAGEALVSRLEAEGELSAGALKQTRTYMFDERGMPIYAYRNFANRRLVVVVRNESLGKSGGEVFYSQGMPLTPRDG